MRILIISVLAVISSCLALGQPSNPQIRFVTVTPSGSCGATNIRLLTPGGTFYTCHSGTWGASSGTGNVTGSGTTAANDVACWNASGATGLGACKTGSFTVDPTAGTVSMGIAVPGGAPVSSLAAAGNIYASNLILGASPPAASVCAAGSGAMACGPEGTTPTGTFSGVGVLWYDTSHFTHINNNGQDSYAIQANALPSVGLLHVAGSTSKATGSLLVNADITPATIGPNRMAAGTFDAQTDAATITWAIGSVKDADASVTLAGNRTLNITNPVVMGNYVFKVTQDGTGTRTLTPGTGCTWKVLGGDGGGTFDISTVAGSMDVIAFTYDGTNCLATVGKAYAAP